MRRPRPRHRYVPHARVSDKTVQRAAAGVIYATAAKKVRAAKAAYDTATDPIKKAQAYEDWVQARMERQTAGRTLRPRRKAR